jgi:hypothetical protein
MLNTIPLILRSLIISPASGVQPDADDTAMGIIALSLLGVPVSAASLVEKYEGTRCYKTYSNESNPSFTTNCNVLRALLLATPRGKCIGQVEKIVHFLCETWWNSSGGITDKWVRLCSTWFSRG